MKKAILINSITSGGAEKVVSLLLNSLGKTENIELICLEKNNFFDIQDVKITYLSQSDGNENSILKLLKLPFLALKLKRYIKKENIKIIQSHIFRANYVNLLAKIFFSAHTAQVVNTTLVSRYLNGGFSGRINLFLIKYLYRHADLIVLKSNRMKQEFNEMYGLNDISIVINNPYDIDIILKKKQEQVSDFVFNKDHFYIISVGRLIKLKRNIDLINALSMLPANIEAVFLGDGNKEHLLAAAEKMNVSARCHFLSNKGNPFKYISRSNLFVMCSEVEGFPNVLVEAMICGLPVISSDCISGPREILSPKSDENIIIKDEIDYAEFGVLYPVGRMDLLAEAITSLLNDRNMCQKYAEAGQSRAQDFDINIISEKYRRALNNEKDYSGK